MRLGRLGALTALVLAGSAGIGFYVAGFYVAGSHVTGSHVTPGASPTTDVANSRAPAAQAPLASDAPESSTPSGQKVKVAVIRAGEAPATEAATPVPAYQREPPAAKPAPVEAKAAQPPETENGGRIKEPEGNRGLVILQIGDSHTSADFLTGELRRRLQARYGRGAPGYITAGHPHIGVQSSTLKVTASPGWTYKSLQRTDAVPAQFWLSGYDAIATAPGETLTFASPQPQTFDMIEIEALRQPEGGKIDVKLDGVVETRYDLDARDTEPVVIRLLPIRAATETIREISITTVGRGAVVIASIAIYNRQAGLTYNSVGYPGAQISLVNKLSDKLLANDLFRIDPHIVVLSFGTNEASNPSLDLAQYARSYERVIDKIKAALPQAAIVVVLPPDFAELPAACRRDKAAPATCGRGPAIAGTAPLLGGTPSTSECVWRTPARLQKVREVQREVAQRLHLVYWDWASIMPGECGAHRWFTASPALMARDHVHFTIEGYKKSAGEFLNTLIPVIEQVRLGENAVPNN